MKWKMGRKVLLAAALSAILAFLAFAMNNTYQAYTQMIIKQQQQHLLLITKAVSQNLEICLSDQFRQVSTLTQTPGFLEAMEEHYRTGENARTKEYIFSYMLADQQGPSRMYLLDKDGREIFHYSQYPFLEDFDEAALRLDTCAREDISGIGDVFPISENHYGMTLINPVYGGNGYLGSVVSVIDLNMLYDRCVEVLNTGGRGEIIIKDAFGTVIMHQNDRMLGTNSRRDLEHFDTLAQYDTMRAMLERQYSQEEGTALYDGYYNGIQPPEKKISAYSRMNLWGTSWYISAELPYSQAVAVEFDHMRKFGILFGAISLVVMASAGMIYMLMRNRQRLELEAGYLREINRTLEELNESREEVRHYQKLTTIGALAGGIAHEFNNLLTPILGYSEFLGEQVGKDNEFYGDIEEIHKAGLRAKEIVEQILPFSRKETDTTSYSSMNLDVVIHDAIKMIRMIVPVNISIREELADENANIYGNATQLHQVLLNLFTNGVQSMDAGGGVLTVESRRVKREELPENYRELAGAEYVEIRVADTGCGMDERVLHQIFNPFFTTKEAGEGTGLGLSVVKDILISHGGIIRVESEPGKGSCFFVYLPVAAEMTPIRAVVDEKKKNNARGLALLLVDDEERVLKYLVKRLKKYGYQADGYSDPKAALEALEKNPGRWDAAVVDYMMPSYKGTVLAQRIRQEQPYMGIVMITGFLESEALLSWKEGIVDSIILKPVNFEELSEAIAKAVQRQHGEGIV